MPDRLPSSQLADLATLRTEKVVGIKDISKPYIGLEHIASGEPFLLGTAKSDSSISTNSVFYKGDVLIGKLRPNLRKSVPAPFDGYCSTDILVLQPNAGYAPNFVARVFQRDDVFNEAVRTAEGTKMPRTSWARLKDYSVFAPEDDAERSAIACILDAADEAIAKTEALIAKLKAIKQGLLHDLLARGLDDNGELRDPARQPEKFKNSPVGIIPKEWDVFHVGAVGAILSGATPSRTVPSYWGGHIPWITPTDMTALRGDYISLGQDWLTSKGLSSCAASLLPVGAIVVTTRASLGLAAITMCELATNQGFKNIIPNGGWDNRFLCYKIRTLTAEMIRRASGTTFLEVSGNQFSQIQFTSPVPDSREQSLIADAISSYNHRITSEEEYLSKLKTIKKGLMQDLLTGRVRVKLGKATAASKR